MMGRLAIIAGVAALAAGCTAANRPYANQAELAQAGNRQCFYSGQVNGFTPLGDDRVQIYAAGRTFELQTSGYCPDLEWSNQVALRSRAGGSWVCHGFDAEVLVPSRNRGGGVDRCLVTDVRLLTPEQARASRAAARR